MRLYEAFLVTGLDSSNAYVKSRSTLTTLELVIGTPPESPDYLPLHPASQLFLRLGYNRGPPIYSLDFVQAERQGALKVPDGLLPVPVRRLTSYSAKLRRTRPQPVEEDLYDRQFDLSQLLDRPLDRRQKALLLCYRVVQNSPGEMPVQNVRVLLSERKQSEKEVIKLPDGFKLVGLRHCLGMRGRQLAFKQRDDLTRAAVHGPDIPSPHPRSVSDLSQFTFPEGVRLSQKLQLPTKFSFITTNQSGARNFCSTLKFFEPLPPSDQRLLLPDFKHPLFVEKAISLVSKYDITEESIQFLKHFYRLHCSQCELRVERIVEAVVNCARPAKGLLTYSYAGCSISVRFEDYSTGKDMSLQTLFKLFSGESVLTLLGAVLLQCKLLIVSSSKALLSLLAQALLVLIYPFEYYHTVITVLPPELGHFLEMPTPFVVGCSKDPDLIAIAERNQVIIVDADTGFIINHDLLPPFPDKPARSLLKKLQPLKALSPGSKLQYIERLEHAFPSALVEDQSEECDWTSVRESFIEFMATILKNYRAFLREPAGSGPREFNKLFLAKEFLSDSGVKNSSFLARFIDTALFAGFIEQRQDKKDQSFFRTSLFDSFIDKKKKSQLRTVSEHKASIVLPLAEIKDKVLHTYEHFPFICGLQSSTISQVSTEEELTTGLGSLTKQLTIFCHQRRDFFYARDCHQLMSAKAKDIVRTLSEESALAEELLLQLFQEEEDIVFYLQKYEKLFIPRVKFQFFKDLLKIAQKKQAEAQNLLQQTSLLKVEPAGLVKKSLGLFEPIPAEENVLWLVGNPPIYMQLQSGGKQFKCYLGGSPSQGQWVVQCRNSALRRWLQGLVGGGGVFGLVRFLREEGEEEVLVDMQWVEGLWRKMKLY